MKKRLTVVLLLGALCVFYAASQEADAAQKTVSKAPLALLGNSMEQFAVEMSDANDTDKLGAFLAPYILIGLGILILARIVSKFTPCVVFGGVPDILATLVPLVVVFLVYYFGKGDVTNAVWANVLVIAGFLLPAVLSVTTNFKYSRMPWAILYSIISIAAKLVTVIAVPILIIAFFTIFDKGKKDKRYALGRQFDVSQKFLLAVIGAFSVFVIGGLVKSPRAMAALAGSAPPRRKWTRKQVSLLLCILLGWLGVHRFYNKKYLTGVLMLLTFGGCGLWVIIDIILICTGRFSLATAGAKE